MSEQTSDNGERKVYFALERSIRDSLIQYIQAAPSPSGIPVSTANALCDGLRNLQVVNILPNTPPSSTSPKRRVRTVVPSSKKRAGKGVKKK